MKKMKSFLGYLTVDDCFFLQQFLQQRKQLIETSQLQSQNDGNNTLPQVSKKLKKSDDRKKKTVFWQESTKGKGKFGTIGTYKNGVLRISKQDLKSVGLAS